MKYTYVDDYVDSVAEKFPQLTKEEVKKILHYGWKQIYQCVYSGLDVSIQSKDLFFFIGEIPGTALKAFTRYTEKLAKRIYYMFRKTKAEWDGYYYFTLSERKYKEEFLNRRKYKVFKNIILHKLYEEVRVKHYGDQYIFRVKDERFNRRQRFFHEYRTDKAELVTVRDPLDAQTIMTSQNKFKYIQQH